LIQQKKLKLGQHIDSNNTKVEVEMLTPKQQLAKDKEMQKIRQQIEQEKALFAAILPPEELKKRRLIQDHIAWVALGGVASGMPEPHL
jgi:hypothetical protein